MTTDRPDDRADVIKRAAKVLLKDVWAYREYSDVAALALIHARALSDAGLLVSPADQDGRPAEDVRADRSRTERAEAEVERLRHLLGSHADGHQCTCTMTDLGVYHGENMHPPEWEQDPWCPTHPDVSYIKAERDLLRAQVAAVREIHLEHECTGYPDCMILFGGACAHDRHCNHCRRVWPCPTIRKLDTAGGGDDE